MVSLQKNIEKSMAFPLDNRFVQKRFPKLDGKVLINSVGTVIGAHTGPGTVALFFFGDKRVD